ncbi:hypothetical protein HK102_011693 [Quaeritorhiza haematococci]|nr:hypothetical protein HK102_011693 [Quaeritorhiza haematococci]
MSLRRSLLYDSDENSDGTGDEDVVMERSRDKGKEKVINFTVAAPTRSLNRSSLQNVQPRVAENVAGTVQREAISNVVSRSGHSSTPSDETRALSGVNEGVAGSSASAQHEEDTTIKPVRFAAALSILIQRYGLKQNRFAPFSTTALTVLIPNLLCVFALPL